MDNSTFFKKSIVTHFLLYSLLALLVSACGGGNNTNHTSNTNDNTNDKKPETNLEAPTASAGVNQTVTTGDIIKLAGSGAGKNTPFTYQWTQTAGLTVTLSDATIANPSFSAPVVAIGNTELLTFELTVMDTASATDKASVIITVLGKTVTQNDRPTRFEWDYDNNGVIEEVLTYTYDSNGRVTKMNRVYTDDGTPDLFQFVKPTGEQATEFSYNIDGKMVSLRIRKIDSVNSYSFYYNAKTGLLERTEIIDATGLKDIPNFNFYLYSYTNNRLSEYSYYRGQAKLDNTLIFTDVLTFDANGRLAEKKNSLFAYRYTWNKQGKLILVEEDGDLDNTYEITTETLFDKNTGQISKVIFKNLAIGRSEFSNYTAIASYDSNNILTSVKYDTNNDGTIDGLGKITARESGPCIGVYLPTSIPSVGQDNMPGSNTGDLSWCN